VRGAAKVSETCFGFGELSRVVGHSLVGDPVECPLRQSVIPR
jgi:hypothetical protein